MLKRVKIQGYKSLLDVEVNLQPLSVLFGPNATGKSNFLDALQLLSRIATSTRLKDAFALPYRGKPLESFTFGSDGVQGLRAKQKVVFSIEVDVEISRHIIDDIESQAQEMGEEATQNPPHKERFLRYHVEIEMLPQVGTLRVADEYLAALDESGALKNQPLLLEAGLDVFIVHGQDPHTRSVLKRRMVGRSIFAERPYLARFPYIETLRQELLSWSFFYLDPRERMRSPSPVREVERIGEMGEDIAAFLYTLRSADKTQFKAVESALHMAVPSINGLEVGIDNLGDVELTFLEGQTPVSARVISDGTLSMLGLLAIGGMREKASLIGFEEPEISIHPDRLRLVASLLKSRSLHSQIIVTTHSPVLLDLIPRENLLVCRKKQGHTIIDPFSNWELSDSRDALDDDGEGEEELAVSERVLRGDFDA